MRVAHMTAQLHAATVATDRPYAFRGGKAYEVQCQVLHRAVPDDRHNPLQLFLSREPGCSWPCGLASYINDVCALLHGNTDTVTSMCINRNQACCCQLDG